MLLLLLLLLLVAGLVGTDDSCMAKDGICCEGGFGGVSTSKVP